MCIRKGPRSYHTRRRRVGMMAAAKRYTYVLYRSAAFSSLILINQQIITSLLQYYATLAITLSLSLSHSRARPLTRSRRSICAFFRSFRTHACTRVWCDVNRSLISAINLYDYTQTLQTPQSTPVKQVIRLCLRYIHYTICIIL